MLIISVGNNNDDINCIDVNILPVCNYLPTKRLTEQYKSFSQVILSLNEWMNEWFIKHKSHINMNCLCYKDNIKYRKNITVIIIKKIHYKKNSKIIVQKRQKLKANLKTMKC